jgi:hypothetical protein
MKTVLLTLGRLPKGLDVARSFARAGWRVIVADPFPRHVLGASRAVSKSYQVRAPASAPQGFLDDLLAIIETENVRLVVPVSEEILYVAALRDMAPAYVRILAMPQADLLALHDKAGFIAFAQHYGLSVPETYAADSDEARTLASSGASVLKPRHSCAGIGVQMFANGVQTPALKGAILQRAIAGAEHSVCALAHEGVVQASAIYCGAMMSGTVAVSFERVENEAIQAWVATFVAAAKWCGFISFDFIVDESGTPWGIECNPRLTSGVHFFETDDIAGGIIDPASHIRLRKPVQLQQFWPCLSETQASFGDWARLRTNIGMLFSVRDVTWARDDPYPLVGQPWSAWPIIALSRKLNCSFGEAASQDFLWRGIS